MVTDVTKDDKKGFRVGVRHVQVLLLFSLVTVCYSLRTNLSIAIVAMTDPTASPNPDVPTYEWTNTGVILSAFFWSYLAPQVFAGHIAERYGPKWILGGAMFVNGIASCLIPLFAQKFGSEGVVAWRVIQGLGQGLVVPSVHAMLGKWAPEEERAVLGVFAYSGTQVGQIIAMPITGYLSASWLGWPVSFYLMGAISIVWTFFWICFGYNSPSQHPTISLEEAAYIQSSLGVHEKKRDFETPWLAIMTSLPYWAIILGEFGVGWINVTMSTQTSIYLHNVLKFDIESNGLLSITPNIAYVIIGFIFAFAADFIHSKGWSIGKVRRVFHIIGIVPVAISMGLLGFLSEHQAVLCVILLDLSLGFMSTTTSTCTINHMDLSPTFAGTLMGISNAIAMTPGIFVPLIVQFVVTDLTDVTQWRTIFISGAVVTTAMGLFYVTFASGERQEWDKGLQRQDNLKDIDNKC